MSTPGQVHDIAEARTFLDPCNVCQSPAQEIHKKRSIQRAGLEVRELPGSVMKLYSFTKWVPLEV